MKMEMILLDSGIKKKERIGFVGLSSPTAYLYDLRKYVPSNPWEWNPILESPQGLSILYDKVLFLHKALCPFSMVNLDYVSFVENLDAGLITKILRICDLDKTDDLLLNYVDVESPPDFSSYNEHIEFVFGKSPDDYPIDNHSLSFDFFNISMSGNSQNSRLLLFDLMVLNEIQNTYPEKQFDLVTNKFTAPRLMYNENELNEKSLTQDFLIKGSSKIPFIPVLQNELGPNLDYIQKLRSANSIIDFREKILNEINMETKKDHDVEKLAYDMRVEFKDYRDKTLYKPNSKLRETWTVSSLLISGLSFLLPSPAGRGIRTIISTADKSIEGYEKYQHSKYSWTSFVTAINAEKERMEDEKDSTFKI